MYMFVIFFPSNAVSYDNKLLPLKTVRGGGGGGLGTTENNASEQKKIVAIHCAFLVSLCQHVSITSFHKQF